MMMSPARVGHGVSHHPSGVTLVAYGAGGAVALVLVIVFAPEAAAWEVASTVLGAAAFGKSAVSMLDVRNMLAPSISGFIRTGFETVRLGEERLQAARAFTDTTANCAAPGEGWEGSKTVLLGDHPMSRIGDRLKCQGVIVEGESSIHVGGDPSQAGTALAEGDGGATAAYWLTLLSDAVGTGAAWNTGIGLAKQLWTGAGMIGFLLDTADHPASDAWTVGAYPSGLVDNKAGLVNQGSSAFMRNVLGAR